MRKLFVLSAILLAPFASAQLLDTDVWLGRLDMSEGRFAVWDLENISDHPGYDNQPSFLPGGDALLFTTEASSLDDSGLGVHAVRYDIASNRRVPLADAKGFSPTPAADGKQLMMLRQGRVWLHDAEGRQIRALTDTSDAGYFTRFDDRTWALFINDEQRRIVIYDAKKKSMETMAAGAITAPYRVPGEQAVTFVVEKEGKLSLHRLDLRGRKVTTLAAIPFPTGGHHVWTTRGTLLMASGGAIHEWSARRPDEWPVVHRFEEKELQGLTRIAISPGLDRIALVSTQRGEVTARNARAASNAALAARDAARAAAFFAEDATVIRANGTRLVGRGAIAEALSEQFTRFPDTLYVRTPEVIAENAAGDVVTERGTWSARWRDGSVDVESAGDYMAVWRRTVTGSGTASWALAAELFSPRR